MKPRLIRNARQVLARAWSVRLMMASAVLSAAEAALPYWSGLIEPGTMALLAMVTSMAAAVARVLAQPELEA